MQIASQRASSAPSGTSTSFPVAAVFSSNSCARRTSVGGRRSDTTGWISPRRSRSSSARKASRNHSALVGKSLASRDGNQRKVERTGRGSEEWLPSLQKTARRFRLIPGQPTLPKLRVAGSKPVVRSLKPLEAGRFQALSAADDTLRAFHGQVQALFVIPARGSTFTALGHQKRGRRFMHRIIAASAAALALACVGSAAAVVYGEPDGNRHPNSGALLAPQAYSDGTWASCTGTLISPTAFLTAANCDWDIPRLAVTFDSVRS